MVTIFPVAAWLAAIVATALSAWFGPKPVGRPRLIELALRYLFIFPLGVMGLWLFLAHALFPQETAAAIGWAPSPFQYEVGLANLGLGLAALYAAFADKQAKLAVALGAACFLIGSGFGHVSDLMDGDPVSPGNAGPILFSDFLTPILAFVLLWLAPSDQPEAEVELEEIVPEREALRQLPPPRGPRLQAPQTLNASPRPRPASPPKPSVSQPSLSQPSLSPPTAPQASPAAASPSQPRLEDELERARQAMRDSFSKDRGPSRR